MIDQIKSNHIIIFKKDSVLLVKHGEKAAHLTGVYGLPGGRSKNYESEKQTAVREVFEETGILVETSWLKEFPGNIYSAYIKRKIGPSGVFTMKVFVSAVFSGSLKKSEETQPEWVKISKLSAINLLPNVEKAILTARKFLEKPKISIIAAIGKNRELGKEGKLLWHIPEDLKRFKKLTTGHIVIMGRKTFESIGKPLEKRINIVITKDKKYLAPKNPSPTKVKVCHSLDEALETANLEINKNPKLPNEVFIAGGAQIYQQAIKYADKLYLTIVKGKFAGDAFFPQYRQFKKVVAKKQSRDNNYQYIFLELEK